MKRKHLVWVLLFFLSSFSASSEKHALIIAIGEYSESSGWTKLSSENDVRHVKAALKIHGFKESNITLLKDENATKRNIVEALNDLKARILKGDIVYVHFSGHGQQVFDDNGDEVDKLDEAFVPYDSPLEYKKGVYEGENLLRDDQLGQLIAQIRIKSGTSGQVVLILDSCHSGTGVRGFGKTRGTDKIMAGENFKGGDSKDTRFLVGSEKTKLDESKMASLACMFGASADELNYETIDRESNPIGSLSFALSEVLASMQTSYSFDELFERIKLKMKSIAPRQNPKFEGAKSDFVFGGQGSTSEFFFPVDEVLSPDKIKASLGTLHGVFEGSEVNVHSFDENKVIARGFVERASLLQSELILNVSISKYQNDLLKVELVSMAAPKTKLAYVIKDNGNSSLRNGFKEVLNDQLLKEVADNPQLVFELSDDRIKILSQDGSAIYESFYSQGLRERIKFELDDLLQSYALGQYMRSYGNTNSLYNVELSLVQVDCNSGKRIKKIKSGQKVAVGTCVQFEIVNSGGRDAYFGIIDIQPENTVNVILPSEDLYRSPDECFIKRGESFLFDFVVEIAEPFGKELLKVISSKSPVDLSMLNGQGDYGTRGGQEVSPFESGIYNYLSDINTRGAKVKRSKRSEFGTYSFFFDIY